MNKRKAGLLLYIFIGISLTTGCVTVKLVQKAPARGGMPSAPREFRAAWVATVSNINWPSKPGLSTEQQQQEAIDLLDLLKDNNYNAVIFQVRPQCDALYASELEPWSYYLTGEQGKAPDPYYDPLEFWIEEAHDRGLELHAWFNPYRAHTGPSEPSEGSIVKRQPELVKRLENGTYWLDPARKETQDHSYAVVMDVVRRYDVDGIHFDDYFYPYPEYNGGKDFPDDESWEEYKNKGGRLNRNDWRRDAVNRFIDRLYKGIKKEKRYVKFGLSPFGIWRPGYPESITGLDQYNVLYADARLWLNKGWIDYWTPQLYWPVNQIPQSFPVLLEWWSQENKKHRHFWPGINISRGSDECINQIMITRGMLSESPGTVHWSIGSLRGEGGELVHALVAGPYAGKALVPPSPWLDKKAPAAPLVNTVERNGELVIHFTHPNDADVFRWVVYMKQGKNWRYEILNRKERSYSVPIEHVGQMAVTAVDRTGNESAIKLVHIGDSFDPAAFPIIDELCQGVVDDGYAPGVALLIGRGDRILMRNSYGRRMTNPTIEPMTIDTLFDLASITKATCTSAAAMLLVQDGRISLDDPVARYVPEFHDAGKDELTLLHLLTHTSGLPAYTNAAALAQDYGPRPNPEGLMRRIGDTELSYETGEDYIYSCLNYLTLARVVQNVTGENMETFLRRRLWEPLGMNDTTFYPDEAQIARSAPTSYNDNELRRGLVHDPLAHYSVCETYAPGNAGAFSTVDDMSRYARLLLGGGRLGGVEIFKPEILERIMTDQAPRKVARRTCGWGVYTSSNYSTPLNRSPETVCLGHTGYTGNIFWMDKLSGAYVIMFTNCVYPDDASSAKDGVIAARGRIIRTVIDHLDIYQDR